MSCWRTNVHQSRVSGASVVCDRSAATTASEASETEESDGAWSWNAEGEGAVREDDAATLAVVERCAEREGTEVRLGLGKNELTELDRSCGIWRNADAALVVRWR